MTPEPTTTTLGNILDNAKNFSSLLEAARKAVNILSTQDTYDLPMHWVGTIDEAVFTLNCAIDSATSQTTHTEPTPPPFQSEYPAADSQIKELKPFLLQVQEEAPAALFPRDELTAEDVPTLQRQVEESNKLIASIENLQAISNTIPGPPPAVSIDGVECVAGQVYYPTPEEVGLPPDAFDNAPKEHGIYVASTPKDHWDAIADLHQEEDHVQHEHDGRKLPIFKIYAHCVLAGDCCIDDEVYATRDGVARALCLKQPRDQDDLAHHRAMAQACPVSAIVESNDWGSLPTPTNAKPRQ